MTTEKRAKDMYNKYGRQYNSSRILHKPERLYNEFLELPSMVAALGDLRGKKILDVGCGAGSHLRQYIEKGAIASGCDISATMISLAKKACPKADLHVAPARKLPFTDGSFDIVTCSLVVNYLPVLDTSFREIRRVLKKGGLFFYTDLSPQSASREEYEDEAFKISAVGYVKDKKTGSVRGLGRCRRSFERVFEMVPGMTTIHVVRPVGEHVRSLSRTGFQLIDIRDCFPNDTFRLRAPKLYKVYVKFPLFVIFISRKIS